MSSSTPSTSSNSTSTPTPAASSSVAASSQPSKVSPLVTKQGSYEKDRLTGSDTPSSSTSKAGTDPEPEPVASSPLPKASKKQTVEQLRDGLAAMGLDTKGKKETLWRRLLNAVHRASLRDPPSDSETESGLDESDQAGPSAATPSKWRKKKEVKQHYRSFLCFDVEATCREGKEFDWPNEIIEFPVVLLRWTDPDSTGKRRLQKIDTFQSYVRPTWQPQLSDFCKTLTGITQETVDAAPTFPQMLKRFEMWLDRWDLREKDGKGLKEALWVTDGPWDLRDFGPYLNIKNAVQSVLSETYRRKAYAAEHPNDPPNERALAPITTAKLSRIIKTDGKIKEAGPSYYFNIPGMLEALRLGSFEGRQHSGLDDATNVGRILIALSEMNVVIEPNGKIHPPGSGRKYAWMGKNGQINWEEWMSDNKTKVLTTPAVPQAGQSKGQGSTELNGMVTDSSRGKANGDVIKAADLGAIAKPPNGVESQTQAPNGQIDGDDQRLVERLAATSI